MKDDAVPSRSAMRSPWLVVLLLAAAWCAGRVVCSLYPPAAVRFPSVREWKRIWPSAVRITLERTPFRYALIEDSGGGRCYGFSSGEFGVDYGYNGPVVVLVILDDWGVVRKVVPWLQNETPWHASKVFSAEVLKRFRRLGAGEPPRLGINVDGVSGATVSMEALCGAVERCLRAAREVIPALRDMKRRMRDFGVLDTGGGWSAPGLRLLLLLASFAAAAHAVFSPFSVFSRRAALALGVGLGLSGVCISGETIFGLFAHGFSAVASSHVLSLLLVVTLLTSLVWGRWFCGYLCPFGALQEWAWRLGRRMAPASSRLLEVLPATRIRSSALLLLGAVVFCGAACWPSARRGFDPIYFAFIDRSVGWLAAFPVLVLLHAFLGGGRNWCSGGCPVGALLGLPAALSGGRTGPPASLRLPLGADGCIGCPTGEDCRSACPVGLDPRLPVDPSLCLLCGECLRHCNRRRRLSVEAPPAGKGSGDVPSAANGGMKWSVSLLRAFVLIYILLLVVVPSFERFRDSGGRCKGSVATGGGSGRNTSVERRKAEFERMMKRGRLMLHEARWYHREPEGGM